MKKMYRMFFALLILALVAMACRTQATSDPTAANLFVVVGNSAYQFAGNGDGDNLLLDQFSKEKGVQLFVQVANDREMREWREKMVTGQSGAPDVLIVDDSLDADGLQKVKLIASHKVGVAIRSDIVNSLALQGNVLSYADFVSLMKSGAISVVASNAMAGSASREFFFSTMAWCSGTDAANLTADIVRLDSVKPCGKAVYDQIKSTNGSNEALDLVYNAALSGEVTGYNTVVTFDSDLLGDNGLNAKLMKQGKPVFYFFYFREATAQANVAIGTRDLGGEMAKNDLANALISYLIDENSLEGKAQNAINLAGFTEGSAALVGHNDSAFKAEWGVASNPFGVQVVNAPISAVADRALEVYRDMYKRTKITKACIDVSPSMLQNPKMDIMVGSNQFSVYKIQALDRPVLKITDPAWLQANRIVPGPSDVFEYYFFSTMTSDLVVSSYGTDTQPAGQYINSLIGPWDENHPEDWNRSVVETKLYENLNGFQSNGTEMFDCGTKLLEQIKANYNSEVDYIIVILTDGENMNHSILAGDFYQNWKAFGHSNITVIGIAFGTDGVSINKDYTAQFNGTTFNGDNDQGLIDAFKAILGN